MEQLSKKATHIKQGILQGQERKFPPLCRPLQQETKKQIKKQKGSIIQIQLYADP